MVKAAAIN